MEQHGLKPRVTSRKQLASRAATAALGLFCLVPAARGADWPRFRGPDGSGVSSEKELPAAWSDTSGVTWKADLPGPGSSCPIVSKGKIFVTCYSGYGAPGGGTEKKPLRHVVCLDPANGKIVWDKTLESPHEEAAYQGIGIPNHGYASSTPAADGERVYSFFGTAGVVCHDFDGKELWRAAVSPDPRTHNFGSASSPVVQGEMVIVPASIECEAIVAFDRKSGKEAWRATCKGYGGWWGTPVPAEAEGRTDLVFALPGELWALNPETGKLRWFAGWPADQGVCTSPIVVGGLAYAVGGRQGGATAVRVGGKGDVTGTHVAWKASAGSYVPSPVLVEGHLYWVTDRGIAFCVKADTGDVVYQERLENAGSVYASITAGDGKLYVTTRRNGTFVIAAKPKFEVLGRNTLSSDSTDFNASPAVSGGRVYLRSNRSLYAIQRS